MLFASKLTQLALPGLGVQPKTIVVKVDSLKQAVEGWEGFVRPNLDGDGRTLKLSSAGAYALVTAVTGVEAEWFWRPGSETS